MGYLRILVFVKSLKCTAIIKKSILFLSVVSLFVHAGCTSFDKIQTELYQSSQHGENRLELLNGKYIISPPDVIQIVVSDNPELTITSVIRPDGNIFIPIVGDVYVDGLTTLEVRSKVHVLIGRYLKGLPKESVSVQVVGFNSKRVYVYGYASGLVAIPFTGDVTVLDAITQSSMLISTSNKRKVKVIRGEGDPSKKPQKLVLNLNDIIKRGRTEENIVLRPNDVVYIPPTFFGRIGYAIQDLLFPARPIQQAGSIAASAQYNALGFGSTGGSSSSGSGVSGRSR